MFRTLALSVLLLTLAAGCDPQAEGEGEGGDTTVLTGARLIDGTGAPPVEDAVLVIRGDRLVDVGPAGSVTIPEGARTVDLAGRTIMPPMINLHGHVARTLGLENSVRHYTEENVLDKLNQYARYGVLHVVSLGGDQPLAYEIRDRQRAGDVSGARLYTADRGFGVEGGYPPARPDQVPGNESVRTADPDSARAAVAEMAEHEPDFVKMWVEDRFGQVPKMTPEVYGAIIDESNLQGLPATAHVFRLDDSHQLVDAGIAGLVHSVRDVLVDAALIEKMKAQGVFLTPTLVREESMFIWAGPSPYLDDPFFTDHLQADVVATLRSPEYQERSRAGLDVGLWQEALRMAQQNLKTMYDAGVKVGLGSDSGPPARFEGYFEHRELELMADAGLTPMQVIEIATRNSAEILGIAEDFGTLEAGKKAEFLVLGANPLEDISNTKTLEQVWQDGVRIF